MKPSKYIEKVLETESCDYTKIAERLSSIAMIRLLHATLGMVTEVGEIADQVKKHVFYGKPLDKVNIIEELGDTSWYMSMAINVLQRWRINTSWEKVWQANVDKLELRYSGKFSEHRATDRDLGAERDVLEGK